MRLGLFSGMTEEEKKEKEEQREKKRQEKEEKKLKSKQEKEKKKDKKGTTTASEASSEDEDSETGKKKKAFSVKGSISPRGTPPRKKGTLSGNSPRSKALPQTVPPSTAKKSEPHDASEAGEASVPEDYLQSDLLVHTMASDSKGGYGAMSSLRNKANYSIKSNPFLLFPPLFPEANRFFFPFS